MTKTDDPGSWVFSLTNPSNLPAKMECFNGHHSLHGRPMLYFGDCLKINFHGDYNRFGFCHQYDPPPNGMAATVFFTGGERFVVGEMEVFEVR